MDYVIKVPSLVSLDLQGLLSQSPLSSPKNGIVGKIALLGAKALIKEERKEEQEPEKESIVEKRLKEISQRKKTVKKREVNIPKGIVSRRLGSLSQRLTPVFAKESGVFEISNYKTLNLYFDKNLKQKVYFKLDEAIKLVDELYDEGLVFFGATRVRTHKVNTGFSWNYDVPSLVVEYEMILDLIDNLIKRKKEVFHKYVVVNGGIGNYLVVTLHDTYNPVEKWISSYIKGTPLNKYAVAVIADD